MNFFISNIALIDICVFLFCPRKVLFIVFFFSLTKLSRRAALSRERPQARSGHRGARSGRREASPEVGRPQAASPGLARARQPGEARFGRSRLSAAGRLSFVREKEEDDEQYFSRAKKENTNINKGNIGNKKIH